ncbi:MAG: hypothetical protein ACQEVA_17130 [Myxococcota bacterium]
MRYLVAIIFGVMLCASCDNRSPSSKDAIEPSCQEVVERADQLAIEWAAQDGPDKAQALRSVIERERAGQQTDPAIKLCEEQLSAEQKRCVMRADDLVAKNECIQGKSS